MEAELRRLASKDPLTELATRQHFLTHMDSALSRLQRSGERDVAVLMLDLDHFKGINEALGYLAGDAVLRLFSALLRDELRKVDFAGRIDGEKFAVLLPDTDQAAARIFAERLRKKVVETSVTVGDRQVSITVSIGIAIMSMTDASTEQSLGLAQRALSTAKLAGGNQTQSADRTESRGGATRHHRKDGQYADSAATSRHGQDEAAAESKLGSGH
jgi:diguanylate cyclase (GGDEF)-like protein